MKLIHLSDLHLGKRVNGFSMLEDQAFILRRILKIIDDESPRAVLIAGDIYDKPVPPAEAVELFDDFLVRLSGRGLEVFVISGNHDSPERLAFGGRLMAGSGIHLSPVYSGQVSPVTLRDEYGPVCLWMLPLVKPASVRAAWPEEEISSYTDALRTAIAHMEIDQAQRNVLITHQFVTGASRCDSEEVSVGGADNVDAAVFAPFDYVALGHIHGPQNIGPAIRYCGTPLKYSFTEKGHVKSVTVAELGPKGQLSLRALPLTPRHDLREIRGSYEQLTLKANYENTAVDDYIRAVLTDEQDVPDAMARLRVIYPNLMQLDYDNARTHAALELSGPEAVERRSEIDLFAEFYEKQNGQPMTDAQRAFAEGLLEKIREEAP